MHRTKISASRWRSRLAMLLIGAGAAGAAALAACHDENPPERDEHPATPATLEALSSKGPYGFATRQLLLVDETRSTPPNASFPGAPERTLPVRVYYPALPPTLAASPPPAEPVPVAAGGPFPLIAYAHGLTNRGEPARHVAEHLATHGYAVVAPLFPLSRGDAPGGPTIMDVLEQPADVGFVLQTIAELDGADADLAAAVDTGRQGILGFSAGGLTALLATYHPALHVEGIDAAVVHSPLSCFLGPAVFQRAVPTLVLSGTADELVPPAGPARVFQIAPPKVVLAELLGATHSGFMGAERPFVENSDALECERLLAVLSTEGPPPPAPPLEEGISRGAGPGAFDPSACAPVCGERLAQTMGATRQLQIARAATLAHFEATLRGRQDAAAFLADGLDSLPDVEVQSKP